MHLHRQVPPHFAELYAEMYNGLSKGLAQPVGDRVVEGKTPLESLTKAPSRSSYPNNNLWHPGVKVEAFVPTAPSYAGQVLGPKAIFRPNERHLVEAFDAVVLAQLGITVAGVDVGYQRILDPIDQGDCFTRTSAVHISVRATAANDRHIGIPIRNKPTVVAEGFSYR